MCPMCAMFNVQYLVFSVQCEVVSVRCIVASSQCAVRCVQCKRVDCKILYFALYRALFQTELYSLPGSLEKGFSHCKVIHSPKHNKVHFSIINVVHVA